MDVFSVPWFSLVGLSLLTLLCSLLFSGQCFAYAASCSTNAFVGFRFRHVAGVTFRRRNMMFGHRDPNVRRALLIAECAAHRSWAQPLPARAFIHETFRNKKRVHIEWCARIVGFALRVGSRASPQLFNRLGRGA